MGRTLPLLAAILVLASGPTIHAAIYDSGDILVVEIHPIGGVSPQIVAIDPVTEDAPAVSSAWTRHLWEERVAHLVAGERNEDEDEDGRAHEEPDASEAAQFAGGRDTTERDCSKQAQPDVEGRTGLTVGRHEQH